MSHSIVVSGATGFVGSRALEELNRIDHKELHIIAACRDRRKLIAEFKSEVRESTGKRTTGVYSEDSLEGSGASTNHRDASKSI